MHMTFDNYIKHPMHAIELKLNTIIARNPHLINSLNSSLIHQKFKNSHITKDIQ